MGRKRKKERGGGAVPKAARNPQPRAPPTAACSFMPSVKEGGDVPREEDLFMRGGGAGMEMGLMRGGEEAVGE